MRIVVWFLLACIPLSAASIDLYASCSTAPTTQGPGWASCGDSFDTASATAGEFHVDANASAGPGGSGFATASFSDDVVFTFFGGTGVGFAQPWLTRGFSQQIGSSGVATASLGGCEVGYSGGDYCPWNSVYFTFGVPETITLRLYAGAAASGGLYTGAAADGEASYNGFRGFYDFDGNALSGVTYEIGSSGQSSPEPGTMLLTALAAAALLACSRRH